MERRAYRTDLSDEEWAILAPLIPPAHSVDLMTTAGSAAFGAVWRGIEAKLVECPALSDSRPEFPTTYDVEPHAELLGYDDIEIVTVGTGADALQSLRDHAADCVVLDLRLPDMSGFEVLEQMKVDPAMSELPVVVFTGRELSAEEDARIHSMARTGTGSSGPTTITTSSATTLTTSRISIHPGYTT